MSSNNFKISKNKEDYISNLHAFDRKLKKIGKVESRVSGHGYGAFIYVKGASNSAEVMEDEIGVWVEFWVIDEDDPDHDKYFSTYEEAYAALQTWIKE